MRDSRKEENGGKWVRIRGREGIVGKDGGESWLEGRGDEGEECMKGEEDRRIDESVERMKGGERVQKDGSEGRMKGERGWR